MDEFMQEALDCIEYANDPDDSTWGTLSSAIAEAVFMLGLERNPVQLQLTAYAPLFILSNKS